MLYELVLPVTLQAVEPYYCATYQWVEDDSGACCTISPPANCGSFEAAGFQFLSEDGEYYPYHTNPNMGGLSDCYFQPTSDYCGITVEVDPNSSTITADPTYVGNVNNPFCVEPCQCTDTCNGTGCFCGFVIGTFTKTVNYANGATTTIQATLAQSTVPNSCAGSCSHDDCFLELTIFIYGYNALYDVASSTYGLHTTDSTTAVYRSYTVGTYAQRIQSLFRLVSIRSHKIGDASPFCTRQYLGQLESDVTYGAVGQCDFPVCDGFEDGGLGAQVTVEVDTCFSCVISGCTSPALCGKDCVLNLIGLPDLFHWRNIASTISLSLI